MDIVFRAAHILRRNGHVDGTRFGGAAGRGFFILFRRSSDTIAVRDARASDANPSSRALDIGYERVSRKNIDLLLCRCCSRRMLGSACENDENEEEKNTKKNTKPSRTYSHVLWVQSDGLVKCEKCEVEGLVWSATSFEFRHRGY